MRYHQSQRRPLPETDNRLGNRNPILSDLEITEMSGRKSKSPKGGSKSSADALAELLGELEELRLDDDLPEECSYERKKSPKKMTSWKSYEKTVDRAPCSPGVYEIKYKDTENPIYIGETVELCKRLKNHRYGKQVIDGVIKYEEEELEARFMRTSTKEEAMAEESRRIERFEKKHGDTPLFNFKRGTTRFNT